MLRKSASLPWTVGLLLLGAAEGLAQPVVLTPNPDPAHAILSPAFQSQTDQDAGWPLTGGNRFELLENGVQSFPRRLDLIRGAQRSLLVSAMIAKRDQTGRQLADELVAAAGRGVEVRVILDGQRTDPRIVRHLRRGGVDVALYNPFFDFGGRTGRFHAKVLMADLRAGIVGGMNIGDAYYLGDGHNDHYKDTDLLVDGDVAAEASAWFLEQWLELEPQDAWARQVLQGRASWGFAPTTVGRTGHARFILQDSDRGRRPIRDYYRRCFDAARQQVLWHVNNLIPAGPVFEGLEDAAARGVRVLILTNSQRACVRKYGVFGYFQYWYLRAVAWYRLRSAGFEVWESDVPLHSKAVTVDGVMASIGSYNFSTSADKYLESTVVVYDPNVVREVEAMFQRDLARATLRN